MSLIPADNPIAAVAGLFVIAAAGFLMEKTRVGALLTGAVWAILFAILASNIGLIPQDSPGYGFVFTYFVPILIPLFLMKADLKKIFFETTRTTLAFLLAALGTVIGAIVAFSIIDIGDNQAAAAGTFTATYIGGSVNYAALVDLTGLREADPSFVSGATAVDQSLFRPLPGHARRTARLDLVRQTLRPARSQRGGRGRNRRGPHPGLRRQPHVFGDLRPGHRRAGRSADRADGRLVGRGRPATGAMPSSPCWR